MPASTAVITAALVRSAPEAYIAYRLLRAKRGPSGEVYRALLLHTKDGGSSWRSVALARTPVSLLLSLGYPTWPPESIGCIFLQDGRLTIEHRDEWVPFEPGGESLWRSSRSRLGLWTCNRLRFMDYEGADIASNELGWTEPLPDWLTLPTSHQLQRFYCNFECEPDVHK